MLTELDKTELLIEMAQSSYEFPSIPITEQAIDIRGKSVSALSAEAKSFTSAGLLTRIEALHGKSEYLRSAVQSRPDRDKLVTYLYDEIRKAFKLGTLKYTNEMGSNVITVCGELPIFGSFSRDFVQKEVTNADGETCWCILDTLDSTQGIDTINYAPDMREENKCFLCQKSLTHSVNSHWELYGS